MLFRQFVDDDLGCASYLLGDEEAGVAAVVDPGFAVEQYADEAHRRGVEIVRVLETHTHADHVSGHGRLALEAGARVSVHAAAGADYPHDAFADGDAIELGAVALRVVHTPGHRPEHCAFAVADHSRAVEPWLVLTGDSLLVGDAARPDLAVDPREGANDLFGSLRRLLDLGDSVEAYPGHVAGSMCGGAMSSKGSTTIGFERRFNPMLRFDRQDEFVTASTGSTGPKPPNVERIVALNRGPFVAAPPPLRPVSGDGCAVLDVRPAETFAAGHVPGAVNVPVSGSAFGTKVGFVLSPSEPIALHADSREQAELAARRLHAVGFLELAGFLDAPEARERIRPIELDELERLLGDGAIDLLDVREADERSAGYIPGSRHVPYRLLRALCDGLDPDRPVATVCETGPRAAIAASILAAKGFDARPVLNGGVLTWRGRGRETIEFRRCGS